jgi:MFS superfamily sulfate permease-like transporter
MAASLGSPRPFASSGSRDDRVGFVLQHRGAMGESATAARRRSHVFASLRGYERSWLRGDLVAGLTVWAILVPQALAYASIAGVSPVVGLYAAPGALVFYALFGSSRVLIVGPMAASAALSAATVASAVPAGDSSFAAFTAALALVAGLAALVAGLLRLGFLANFISQPVLSGFIIGLALTIVIGQLPKLFGIPPEHGNFFEQAWRLITHLGDTQGVTLLVGAFSLALILGLRRLAPRVPGSLVAVAAAIAAVKAFDLDVPTVGTVRSGLPALGLPDMALSDVSGLVAGGLGIALIAFAEGLVPRRPTGRASTPTTSSWRSAAPTSPPAYAVAWSSAAASPRRRSTPRQAPVPRSRACSPPP